VNKETQQRFNWSGKLASGDTVLINLGNMHLPLNWQMTSIAGQQNPMG
jgi:hypothetical protein